MPTYSYGPRVEARAIRLLRALLLFANWEVENPDHFNIRFSWSNKYSSHPKLMVKTNLIALEALVSKDGQEGSLSKEQIRMSLKQMENFLEILEDHRLGDKKGSDQWHFTLTLWSREIQKNLDIFHQEWQRRKSEKSKEQDGEISPPSQIIHNLPRSGVIKFFGREDTLEIIHQQLQESEKVAISSIAGMGGVGKTELALQYAKKYQSTYPGGICWVYAGKSNVGSQIVGYAQAQLGLEIVHGLELQDQVAFCWRNWQAGKVLIVLDDVIHYSRDVQPFLPPENLRFQVLMTTRIKFPPPVQVISLDVLSLEQSLELLKSLVDQERINAESDIAKTLCEWLGYLPLGLELVGRYLAMEPRLSLAKMLFRLQIKAKQRQALKDEALIREDDERAWISTAQSGVEAAFELSWEMLDRPSQSLGKLLSLFAIAPIDWDIVEAIQQKYCQLYPEKSEFSAENVTSSRRKLLKFHLLQEVEDHTYSLHSLIREFFRSQLETQDDDMTLEIQQRIETQKLKQVFCTVIASVAREIPKNPIHTDLVRMTPAILHLTEVATTLVNWLEDDDLPCLFEALGRFYEGKGLYREAEPWREQCLELCQNRLGNHHPTVASSLNNLASLYHVQGRYTKAEPLFQQALKIYQNVLGTSHPHVASSFDYLATLYHAQGRYEEAEPLFQQSSGIIQRLLGEQPSHLASSIHNLAKLYFDQGKYTEAELLFQQALEIRQQLLGEQHPDIATSLNHLATLYRDQKKYTEAESLYRQALEIRQQLLAEQHPDIATSLNHLAKLYKSQGNYQDAESLYRQALEMRQQLFGEQHPDVANSLYDLATLYKSQNRNQEAETLWLQALAIRQQLLGYEHPDVANNLSDLGHFYYFQRQYQKAEPLFRRVLKSYRKLLCVNSPSMSNSINVAALYYFRGKYPEAESLFRQALAFYTQEMGRSRTPPLVIFGYVSAALGVVASQCRRQLQILS